MTAAYVLAGARTPLGRFQGQLAGVTAPELGGMAIQAALRRSGLEPAVVDEVIMGNVVSAGLGQAPARQAALKAGLPPTVAALTINKVCGSGLKAVMLASQAIRAGDASVIVAGGMESMSRAPHLLRSGRDGVKLGDMVLDDALLLDGLRCAMDLCPMGLHAEYTAAKAGVTREDQDRFAVESQQRTARAIQEGAFLEEIAPITVTQRRQTVTISTDEGPRPETDLASLAKLKPAFIPDGTVTAGNASLISDGAAALIVTNAEVAEQSTAPWKARIVAAQTRGGEPRDLFFAPIEAIRATLAQARWSADDVDLYEINEAFAAQMLACLHGLRLDPAKVNIEGGAIALGHPIGASGARVLVTLLSSLKRRGLRRGVASLCLGGGNAVALAVEMVG